MLGVGKVNVAYEFRKRREKEREKVSELWLQAYTLWDINYNQPSLFLYRMSQKSWTHFKIV